MKLVCYIGNQKFRLVQGVTFGDEYNETLDSATIIIRNETKIPENVIQPYRDVIILDEEKIPTWNGYTKGQKFSGFFKHLLISNPNEEDLTLIDADYKYKLDLFSETKGLEIVDLPNTSLTQPLYLSKKRSVWQCLKEAVEMYSPKIKVAKKDENGEYSDIGEWEYQNKYVLDSDLEQIFGDVYAPDFTLNAPTLRDLLSKLMIVKDMIPVVYNDMITCMDISTTHGSFMKKGISTIISSRSSNDYVDNLRTNYSNALSQEYTCKRTEKLGFRNSSTPLMTLQNMRVETGYPIYKINKVYLCYYKQGDLMCTNKGKWFTDGRKVVFLCKQDITKLVKLNEERDVLSQQWDEVVDGQPETIEDLAKYKLCTVGYSQGSKNIEGWGEKTTYPKGFLLIQTGTSTPIDIITDFMNKQYPYGIYSVDYAVNQRLTSWGLSAQDIQDGGYFYLKFTGDMAKDGVFYDPTNANAKVTEVGVRSKMFFFEIEYEAYYNGAIIHSKDNGEDLVTINDNASSSLTLLESHGVFQKEKIDRYGNPYRVIPARYDDISGLQELGTVLEDGSIVFSREYSIYENCILATYKATKHYVLKNYFNTVWAKHRMYNLMPYEESVSRAENKKMILYLSKGKSYWENNENRQLPVSQEIYDSNSLISFIKPSEIISYGDFAVPNLINFGYLTFNMKKTPVNIGFNYENITSPYETLYGRLNIRKEDNAYTIYSTKDNFSLINAGATITITNVSNNFLPYIYPLTENSKDFLKNDRIIFFGMPKTDYNDYLVMKIGDKEYIAKCGEALEIPFGDLLYTTGLVELRIALSASENATRIINNLVIRPQIMDLTRTTSGQFISYDSTNNELELQFKYMSDINCFVSGNSMCFNIAMNDNVTMGNYIKDLVPNPDVSFFHDSDKDDEENRLGALLDYDLIVDDVQTGYCENIGFYVCHREDKRDMSFVFTDDEKKVKIGSFYQTLFSTPKIVDTEYEEIDSNEETMKIGKLYKINKDNKERIDMTFQIEMQKDSEDIMLSTWTSKLNDLIQSNYRKIEQPKKFASDLVVVNIYNSTYVQNISDNEYLPIFIMEITKDLYDYEMIGTSIDVSTFTTEEQQELFSFKYWNQTTGIYRYEFIPDTISYEKERIILIGNQYYQKSSSKAEEKSSCIMILKKTTSLMSDKYMQGIILPNTVQNYYFSNIIVVDSDLYEWKYQYNSELEDLTYNGVEYGGFYHSSSVAIEINGLKHGTTVQENLFYFPYSGVSSENGRRIIRNKNSLINLWETNEDGSNKWFFINKELKLREYSDNYSYLYPQTMYIATSNNKLKEELVYNEYNFEQLLNKVDISFVTTSQLFRDVYADGGKVIAINLVNFEENIYRQTRCSGGYDEKSGKWIYSGDLYNPFTQSVMQPIDGYTFITDADSITLDEETNKWTAVYNKYANSNPQVFYTNIVSIQYWYKAIPNFNELSWLNRQVGKYQQNKYVSQETRSALENASMKFVFGINLTIEDLVYYYYNDIEQRPEITPQKMLLIYYSAIENRDFRVYDDKANVIGNELNCVGTIDKYGVGQYYKKN